MDERRRRVLPWLAGGLAAAALIALLSTALVPAALVAGLAWIGTSRLRSRISPEKRQGVSRWMSGAFLGFFALYATAAGVFLLAGLAPAVARAVPPLHSALHRWSGNSGEVLQITAKDDAFDVEQLVLPTGLATVRFNNLDFGEDHNLAIYGGTAGDREPIFVGDLIRGTDSVTYRFFAPPAGTYLFWCDVHTFMNGKVRVDPALGVVGGPPPGGLRGLAARIAAASHGSGTAALTTGQQLVSAGQVFANYVFSALNILLAILLVRLRPRDRTAQLLAIGMLGTAAVFNSQAHFALDVIPSGLTLATHDSFHVVSGVAYMFGLLMFPDGRLLPGLVRSRWLAPILRWSIAIVFVGLGLIFVSAFHGTNAGGYVAFFGVIIPMVGVLSQALRLRRAESELHRQQARVLVWTLAFVSLASLLSIGVISVANKVAGQSVTDTRQAVFLVFPVLFVIIPLTLVVVLVRYRLWDVQRVLNKALVYGILAAFITSVYVAVVVGIGSAIGTGGQENTLLSIFATAVVAVAFQPLRVRLQRLANVLVYGKRASPYEVLSDFSERVAGSLSIEETLPRMAEAAARGVGAERSRVRVFLPDAGIRSVTWPEGASEESFDRTLTIKHNGEPVGDVWVAKPAGERLTDAEDKLLGHLASQAGLALANVRLTGELEARVEEVSAQAAELRASRQRLVAAQDAAARRLERDLHDGAQQQLVAIAVTARLARVVGGRDPERAEGLLVELGKMAQEALETIRDLARGIYPPLLAEAGLAVALDAQVKKASIPATIEAIGLGRYPSETEAAVYFCCLEAFQNIRKYAHASRIDVRLEGLPDGLEFAVSDDGSGFDSERTPRGSGLQNMADRLAALGGSLIIRSEPGKGTVIAGSLPAATLADGGPNGRAVRGVQAVSGRLEAPADPERREAPGAMEVPGLPALVEGQEVPGTGGAKTGPSAPGRSG